MGLLEKPEKAIPQLIRTIAASNIGFWVDFGLLALLTEVFHVYYLVSATIGFITGTTVVYFLSIFWIFLKRKYERKILEYFIFILIGALGVLLNLFLIWLFTEIAGLHYLLSKLTAGTIGFFYNFALRKFILFR